MARITVEDCLNEEDNRFSLVMLASKRAKQLLSGKTPLTDTRGNKAIVSALREIADGKVRFESGEAVRQTPPKPESKPSDSGEAKASSEVPAPTTGEEVSFDNVAGGSA